MAREVEIKTSSGDVIIIDYCDLAKVQPYTWCRNGADRGAVAYIDGSMIAMHRLILGFEIGESTLIVIKHINGNRLDNRRKNLLVTTQGVAIATSKGKQRFVKNKSGYKGVSPIVQNGKTRWRARAHIDGKEISLGHYDTPEDAALAYDNKINNVYGSIAVTNKSLGLIE